MNTRKILQHFNIPFIDSGNKHCTKGWVNIHCPFCRGSRDFHMGIPEENGFVTNCWRCGPHPLVNVLERETGLSTGAIIKVIKSFPSKGKPQQQKEAKVVINPFKYPQPYKKMTTQYKDYLKKRGFDPDELEKEWGLLQTGPVSILDGLNFSHRILIPIIWKGEVVSFQARDITGKSLYKYIACPVRREKVNLKTIVYGKETEWNKYPAIIVTEGVTDVWRFGTAAVATFGIKFKLEQVMALAKIHDRFFIIFDEEKDAQKQAKDLMVKLKVLGKWARVEKIKGDPGGMKQEDADHLIKDLLKSKRRK